MESLTSSLSRVFSDNYRGRGRDRDMLSSPRDVVVGRPEIRFLSSPRHVSVGFSHLISLQHKRIHPIFVSSLSSSSETQGHLQNEETQIQGTSKTVHVKFQLQKECAFGEQFHIVGNDPNFGSWDPSSSIPLDWSDEHIWTVELDIPIGKSIQFKFILKGSTGTILWQPGRDRILQMWETKNTISISEDWDNTELQMLIEEEPTYNEKAESMSDSEILVTAETASTDTITNPAGEPLQEKSMAIVAENLTEVHTNQKAFGARRIASAEYKPVRLSNEDMDTGENSLGNNGRALILESVADPDLVPGLIPLTTLDTEEKSPSEVNKNVVANALLGIDKAKEHNVPELDLKKELDKGQAEKPQLTKKQDGNNSQPFEKVWKNDIQWGHRTLQKLLAQFQFPFAPN